MRLNGIVFDLELHTQACFILFISFGLTKNCNLIFTQAYPRLNNSNQLRTTQLDHFRIRDALTHIWSKVVVPY